MRGGEKQRGRKVRGGQEAKERKWMGRSAVR